MKKGTVTAAHPATATPKLLTPDDVERTYGSPTVRAQRDWIANRRFGWHKLVIYVGKHVRYRPADVEAWFESRRLAA